jgi:aminocarboxymuconate-semialdehyde decarboxylase
LVFSGTLERLPDLRVAVAHGGGSFPFTIGRLKHGFDCRPDLVACDNPVSPEKYLNRIYYDALVHDLPTLRFLISQVGIDKVAMGSDYPFPLGENVPGSLIKHADFSDTEKEFLLYRNALKWLNLPQDHFK